eukprot:SAG11_NODE_7_length_31267_cov_19.541966_32_plen_79_part_00
MTNRKLFSQHVPPVLCGSPHAIEKATLVTGCVLVNSGIARRLTANLEASLHETFEVAWRKGVTVDVESCIHRYCESPH